MPAGSAAAPAGWNAWAGQRSGWSVKSRLRRNCHNASSAGVIADGANIVPGIRCSALTASRSTGSVLQVIGVLTCGVPTVMMPRTCALMPARCTAARAASPLDECATITTRFDGCSSRRRSTNRTTCSAWLDVPGVASTGTMRCASVSPPASSHADSSAVVSGATPVKVRTDIVCGDTPQAR